MDRRPALVPELIVSDLAVSLAFYLDLIGFEIEYDRPEEKFAYLQRGSARLMLEEARTLSKATPEEFARGEWRVADMERPFGRGMNIEIEVTDIIVVDERIRERGYPMLIGLQEKTRRVQSQRLKVRQLLVADPDGYLIRLSERIEFTPIK